MAQLIIGIFFLLQTIRVHGQHGLVKADPLYNDDNWIWSIFYFSREDKRMFPPKPNGIGWTINFANSQAVVITVLVIVALFAGNKYYKSWLRKKNGHE